MQVQAFQAFAQAFELDVGNGADLRLTQAVEYHHLINAVNQFRAEVNFHVFHHRVFDVLIRGGFAQGLDVHAADVRRHHNYGVFEVYRAALAIG